MSFLEVTAQLSKGFLTTLQIFGITLAGALPLGLLITFGSMSKIKPIKWIFKVFVWIIRGTPLMLQIILVFYGPGLLGWDIKIDRLLAVIVAFIINYACYFSEIYRGGIESISKGQYEAGQVLGMTKSQIFFKVVLFQVVKRIVPPMGNEIITLVKDTSLARVISVIELVKSAQDIISQKSLIWPLFYVGAFYLLFSGLLTILLNYAEKKLNYYQG
ncbi:MAG: amino acid ABC transporter permease [Oscillospiraceae bacterium]|nr:amino acid ABC transporter permease [Oscillospiraceae bacterium]